MKRRDFLKTTSALMGGTILYGIGLPGVAKAEPAGSEG